MGSPLDSVTAEAEGKRRNALRRLNDKRAFWRNVSWYAVLNLAFWMSWVIGGLREEWLAPWPLIPTVVWGAFILYQERRLGGHEAVRHDTMDHDLEQLRELYNTPFSETPPKRPIVFGDSAAYTPIRPFHLQEVIDAREARTAAVGDEAETETVDQLSRPG